ncbi:MAG: hypothetical protein IJD55_01220 [Clostridia bacterium]|nr:hypothetical protein [Clostridia bacterium]
MKNLPKIVFKEYLDGINFKIALGNKGLFEQNKINERFYIGDQWHGAKCGNDRPLVRHNVIKRIGDYKMSQVLNTPISVKFSADGVPTDFDNNVYTEINDYNYPTGLEREDINLLMSVLGDYFNTTAERVNLDALKEKALKNAYITGSSVLYTYWDSSVPTGLFADKNKKIHIKGDIGCEVLDIEDVVFGDPYCENVQNQPYIIISSRKEADEVLRQARLYGADIKTLDLISQSAEDGKINLITKLFKSYKPDGSFTVKGIKITENAIVRGEFDTGLSLYPITVFCWETRNNSAYGDSEITYLIPNQIAINRMITANVWSAMSNGMPIMLVNGDTVTENITNDPGQIIKVFGSNEDVAGAVKYVSPPSFMKDFDESINSLINNTLTQSGANEVALGDSKAENATALAAMRDAALMPLKSVKRRFYNFIEELSRIWADFWITYYGVREIKLSDSSGYINFNGERYKNLIISARVDIGNSTEYNERECLSTLMTLYEKGIIDRKQLLIRMPKGVIPDIDGLLAEKEDNQ